MISEHESIVFDNGAKIEKLNVRLAAMEDQDQDMNKDTRTQSDKRRRVDG